MKRFNAPEIEVIRFNVQDILTTSDAREDEFPIMPVSGDEFPLSDT